MHKKEDPKCKINFFSFFLVIFFLDKTFLQTGSTSWTNLKQCYKNDDNDNNNNHNNNNNNNNNNNDNNVDSSEKK